MDTERRKNQLMYATLRVFAQTHKPGCSPRKRFFKLGWIRGPDRKTAYSARNASMGSRFDARQAGYTPDTTQVMIPTAIAIGM